MQELKTILLRHSVQYPLMEPRDAVKLVYQNEFGGGHLIQDEAGCREYLYREYAATVQKCDMPLLEPIGNGLYRVMLQSLDAHAYSPERLAGDFIRSAASHRGTQAGFLQKLSVLRECTQAGKMPFPPEVLENYLTEYARAGYPPVSHSEAYRTAYHPAYRVVGIHCITAAVTK